MLRETDLKRYVPSFLLEFREYHWIYTVLNKEFQLLWKNIERVLDNFFIETMEEEFVLRMETLLEIVPDKTTQSLAFRRERIKNRLLISPPFTVRYLKKQLDYAIGEGAYELVVDHNQYTIYLESSAVNQNWYHEISFTIQQVKPCNMVFVNKPLLINSIVMEEQQQSSAILYNYRLGSWKLEGLPFITKYNQKIIKEGKEMSLQRELFHQVASFVGEKIAKVKLNDEVVITDFDVKETIDNALLIEYAVKANQIKEDAIRNVKVLNENNVLLTDSNVYVPITNDIMIRHTIRVREGS